MLLLLLFVDSLLTNLDAAAAVTNFYDAAAAAAATNFYDAAAAAAAFHCNISRDVCEGLPSLVLPAV